METARECVFADCLSFSFISERFVLSLAPAEKRAASARYGSVVYVADSVLAHRAIEIIVMPPGECGIGRCLLGQVRLRACKEVVLIYVGGRDVVIALCRLLRRLAATVGDTVTTCGRTIVHIIVKRICNLEINIVK